MTKEIKFLIGSEHDDNAQTIRTHLFFKVLKDVKTENEAQEIFKAYLKKYNHKNGVKWPAKGATKITLEKMYTENGRPTCFVVLEKVDAVYGTKLDSDYFLNLN